MNRVPDSQVKLIQELSKEVETGGPHVGPKKYSITRTRGDYKVTLEVVSERPVSKAALITYSDTLIPTWLFNKLD